MKRQISKRWFVGVELNITLIFFVLFVFSEFLTMNIFTFIVRKKQGRYFYFKNSVYVLFGDEKSGSLSYSLRLLILLVSNWLTTTHRSLQHTDSSLKVGKMTATGSRLQSVSTINSSR